MIVISRSDQAPDVDRLASLDLGYNEIEAARVFDPARDFYMLYPGTLHAHRGHREFFRQAGKNSYPLGKTSPRQEPVQVTFSRRDIVHGREQVLE
jgi:hypothetical protein